MPSFAGFAVFIIQTLCSVDRTAETQEPKGLANKV
jgi:hypothetical protein